jgi:hypothetical protein
MKVLRFPLRFSVDCGEQGRVAEHETTDTGGAERVGTAREKEGRLDLLKGTKSQDAFTASAERLQSKLVQTFPGKDHCGDNFSLTLITRTSYRLGVRVRQSIV